MDPVRGGRRPGARRVLHRAEPLRHPPLGTLGDLAQLRDTDAFRFVNRLQAWAVSDGDRVVDAGQAGGVIMGSTTVRIGPLGATFAAVAFVAGTDVLLHDGQFRDDEQALAIDYGHATMTEAMRLADRCGVGQLVLTHQAPGRTDDDLAATPQGRAVRFPRQGQVLVVKA